MKNLTSLTILLAAVIGFMPAKPAEANPQHHEYNNYHTTSYYTPKPTYHKVYYHYQPKPTYHKVYYYYQPKPTYRYYQPKQHSTHHKVHYYRY